MNDNFKDLKERMRSLDALLSARGTGNVSFAQALSALHRAVRRADRTREPPLELRTLLGKAETLGRTLADEPVA
ncbi:MAG TPA: hypothetical protein VIV57_27345 [Anaeromyxobacter sp.]